MTSPDASQAGNGATETTAAPVGDPLLDQSGGVAPLPPQNPGGADSLTGVGLGTLMALHKRARRGGGQLTLVNMAAHLGEPSPAATPAQRRTAADQTGNSE
jgi:hypothetical protein